MKRIYLFAAVAAVFLVPTACGGPKQVKLTESQVADLAKPATVLIQVDYSARATMPTAEVSQTKMAEVQTEIQNALASGQQISREQLMIALLEDMAAKPLEYFVPGAGIREQDVSVSALGSGFVISPDGAIITNAHVVKPNDAELKEGIATQALTKFLQEDIDEFFRVTPEIANMVSSDLLERLKKADATFLAYYMRLSDVESHVYAVFGHGDEGVNTPTKVEAQLKSAGEMIPGKDVAVLKINGHDLPTLPIGDDSAITTGTRLYVIGFPAAATFHPMLSEASEVEPTFTTGIVSAKKHSKEGFSVFQTDAAMTHGNSGGPTIDESGSVIGLATFGTADPETGAEIPGMNFVVPTSVAREFLTAANVSPSEGKFTELYREAVIEEGQEHYKNALAKVEEADKLSPGLPSVQAKLTQLRKAIADGKDRSGGLFFPVVLICVIAAIVIIAIIIALSNKPKPSAQPASSAPQIETPKPPELDK